jgi:hypothetical protein
MSAPFIPAETLEVFCRSCGKITTNQLERSIAGNGRTIDKNATFEYYCTKCFKTACFSGNDLLEQAKSNGPDETRDYSPHDHFLIGERLFHKKFKEAGLVVSKDSGTPSSVLVSFEKAGLKKLVQDI